MIQKTKKLKYGHQMSHLGSTNKMRCKGNCYRKTSVKI